jgi:hypothetical protein
MSTTSIRRFSFRALSVASALAGGSALADISWNVFTIEATNSQGTASWSGTYDQGAWIAPDVYRWDGGNIQLTDGDGDVIGVLESGTFIAVEDPVVNLLFHVTAGAADTVFSITSGLLGFPAIVNGEGTASTGLTLTDSGQDNGATLNGLGGPSGARSYQANYNGLPPAGTNFAEFVPGLATAIPGGSTAGSDGTGGFLPIPGAVTSMGSRFAFSLSANDSASGTSTFNIRVPEPASVMLVLAGVLAFRRR